MPDEHRIHPISANPDRLLPGEQPHTDSLEDVTHWISLYTELRSTKSRLISRFRALVERQAQEIQDEFERADVRVLVLQLERFDRRLAFWRGRLAELDGSSRPGVSPGSRSNGAERRG
jgi:hypothetical protein